MAISRRRPPRWVHHDARDHEVSFVALVVGSERGRFAAYNERDEADFVITRIMEWTQRGGLRREIAILYRSNAQSRTFEEALISARLPTASTAGCVSSSAPRSRMRWRTCA